jgi:predicted RNA-binding Zn ribbon-like protein
MASAPAPGDLENVRGFVNTINIEEGTDHLSDVAGMVEWFVDAGLLEAGARAAGRDLEAAIRVREALRQAMLANNGDLGNAGAAFAELNRAAEAAKFSIIFCDPCEVQYLPNASGVAGALGRLLSIVAGSMADGTWSRLKACANDECRWAFYDHARNRSGKWCEMAVCGNRLKARTYRARQGAGA